MPYQDRIRDIGSDPEQLELAYQDALKAGEGDAFAAALLAAHAAAPGDVLYGSSSRRSSASSCDAAEMGCCVR